MAQIKTDYDVEVRRAWWVAPLAFGYRTLNRLRIPFDRRRAMERLVAGMSFRIPGLTDWEPVSRHLAVETVEEVRA